MKKLTEAESKKIMERNSYVFAINRGEHLEKWLLEQYEKVVGQNYLLRDKLRELDK